MVPSVAYNDLGYSLCGMCDGRTALSSPSSCTDLAVGQLRRVRKASSRAIETKSASDDIGQHPSQPRVGRTVLVARATDSVHAASAQPAAAYTPADLPVQAPTRFEPVIN